MNGHNSAHSIDSIMYFEMQACVDDASKEAGQGLSSKYAGYVIWLMSFGSRVHSFLLEAVFHAQSRPVVVPICRRTTIGDAVQQAVSSRCPIYAPMYESKIWW